MKIARKLILGVLTTGFVAATLAATTYAWYKLNNAAFTEDFTFNSSTTDGFLVSIDGKTFKHKLSTVDMVKAMVVGKNPTTYQFDDKANVIDTSKSNQILDNKGLAEAYVKLIALEPVTSYDGSSIKGLSGDTINVLDESSSKYVYFNLYFKTFGDTAEEKKTYNLYLDGMGYDDGHYNAPRTRVWSDASTTVDLTENMTTYTKTYEKGEKISVYTSNASRFSIQDLGYTRVVEEEIVDEEDPEKITIVTRNTTTNPNGPAKLYELSDDREYDLGSFATDYDSTTDTSARTQEEKNELDKLYNSNYNAMYTYYNNIKTEEKLDDKLPHFDTDLPQTIRSLTKTTESGDIINSEEVFATVTSGEITKVAFRFWIEGWDGDCFDGLPGYIDTTFELVTGEFDSKKTYYTRSGTGIATDPYKYSKVLIDSFDPTTDYYESVGTEVKESNPINVQLLFNSKRVD